MSDDMVTHERRSRNLMKPGRNANILKGLVALVLGVVLISTVVPAAAQAKGPSITIDRINGQFVVQGHGFPANAKGTVWAELGNVSGQKDVWTQNDGYFWLTFYKLTSDYKGQATAKAWIKSGYAKASKNLSRSANTSAGLKDSSVKLDSATSGNSGTDSDAPATNTTVAPASGLSTTAPTASAASGGTGTTARPTPASTTAAPTKAAPTTKAPTPAPAKPAATSAPAPAVNAGGTGFGNSPGAGWNLNFSDDFTGSSLDRSKWGTYDGSGNAGIGSRSSKQVGVNNGELQITGNGTVGGGMASSYNQTYGLFEARVRMDARSVGYNDALLLWPSSERWPVDGEIDLQEIFDGATSQMGSFAHWGSNNSQSGKTTKGDFSQWHTVAVDWEPGSVAYYVDGQVIYTVTGAGVPQSAHFMALQLDVSSNSNKNSGAQLHVDWVKVYGH